ncbi:hypothetical protein SAMN05421788_102490 [Filimonas lacunae]|uniref:Uncharacterized protein n=1 Tax=Filimonas lacunae TaxID=477680 RepID=A0A173MHC4_9BACT|nr:hypothetical protein FLA_2897 [Filimonas lacunae]SIS98509.1 hypothetical protein SAMN05421788_102490 [Filimonas lacunae]
MLFTVTCKNQPGVLIAFKPKTAADNGETGYSISGRRY